MMHSSSMENINEESSSSSSSSLPRSVQWCVRLGLFSSNSTTNTGTTTADQQQRLQEMHQNFQNLVEQYPFPDEEEDDDDKLGSPKDETQAGTTCISTNPSADSAASNVVVNDLDPLTAMVMEQQSREEHLQQLDLKYRKEKAMRNRGKGSERIVAEEDDNDPRVERAVTLQVIDKDLARLPPPPCSTTASTAEEEAISKRKAVLRRVLYCFHCHTHPTPGYRQGMHEIASYLLHALEVEQQNEAQNNNGLHSANASMKNDDDTQAAAIVYSMLQAILTSILPAYDVASAEEQAVHDKSKPLEGMSRRILSQVALQDAILCRRLQQDLQVPAQLYLTKWIRLLYSREVDATQVLTFWDAIFDMMTLTTAASESNDSSPRNNNVSSSSSSPSPPTLSLMAVLETIAAARLLLWRGRLHVPTAPSGQQPPPPHDDHDTLHLLMNLPMETTESTKEWLNLSRQMIRYNLSRQLLHQYQQQQQQLSLSGGPPPSLPIVTLPPLTAVPGVVLQATKTDAATTRSSHPLTSAPSSNMTPATVFGIPARSNSGNNNNNNMPSWDVDRFSFASLRQNLEETVKSTTQSIGERLHQEWENVATVRVPADQDPLSGVGGAGAGRSRASFPAAAANRGGAASAASAYNITYRDSTLLDPPVPPARATPTAAASLVPSTNSQQQQQHATWARQLQIQTATIQSFLIQVEQDHERQHPSSGGHNDQNSSRVPPLVWEALATLESLRREMISSSSAPTTAATTSAPSASPPPTQQPRTSPLQVNNYNSNRY